MTTGIILIAHGHPYYGKMAAGLAATIKASSCELPIALCFSGYAMSHLNTKEIELFSSLIDINDTPSGIRAKLMLPELSPFDLTIYLDVDMAWLGRDVNELLKQCEGYDIMVKNYEATPIHKSSDDPKAWARNSDIALAYGFYDELYYHLSSECIVFYNTHEVKNLFRKAQRVYDSPKVPFRPFAGGMPDELALSIAMMMTGVYPGIQKWEPVFWRQANKAKLQIDTLREKFFGFSMGGTRCTENEKHIYDVLISSAYHQLGIANPHRWVNKHRFLPERKNL